MKELLLSGLIAIGVMFIAAAAIALVGYLIISEYGILFMVYICVWGVVFILRKDGV